VRASSKCAPGTCCRMDEVELPPRLSEVLDPAAQRAGIEGGAKVGIVWNKWVAIVGPEVARHAEPTSLRAGVLRVRADSPAWAGELAYFGGEITRRANDEIGAPLVREVRVWTGPGRIENPNHTGSRGAAGALARRGDREADIDPRAVLERAHRAWQRRARGARR
jgi:predicted nucleic acid-binding Zn ribbon protein